MVEVASEAAAIISFIVAGPSNSSVTLLPAIRGTPVAASSSTARAFMSGVACAQRRASKSLARLVCSGPPAVAAIGAFSPRTSGRATQDATVPASPRTAIHAAIRNLLMIIPCLLQPRAPDRLAR